MAILYRQLRVGRDGKQFEILKFETMQDGVVTRPLLRRLGLDELPQLVNVLRGEMAIFGPRPELPARDQFYCDMVDGWRDRHSARPGILALAQVMGIARDQRRYTLEAKTEQARYDLEQIRGPWLRTRLRILARLPGAIFRGQTTEAPGSQCEPGALA